MTPERAEIAKGMQDAAVKFRASQDAFTAAADAMRKCAEYAEQFAQLVDSEAASSGKHKGRGSGGDAVNGKRKRKEKDPNAPKRPTSSYILYQNAVRGDFKTRNPDMPYQEVVTMMKNQWNSMSEQEKAVYNDKAKKDKQRYQTEKDAYDARSPAEVARDNAKAAEAAAAKKAAGRKPRVPRQEKVPISPPLVATDEDDDDEEEDEEEEEEEAVSAVVPAAAASESESSEEDEDEDDDEEDEEPEAPPAKKAKTAPAPAPSVEKDKKKKKSGKA
uniref:HMG box domain-containing protein n=1 Tax=Mycena chlorophos TaxID=658473 RepID=A0ABQ0L4X3_MYCCL|nr:predicted protein [Mycena chlorophos]